MTVYDFIKIKAKWQKYCPENQVFKVNNYSNLQKYYVMDMFLYHYGAGLNVGHLLEYIASDIYSRYKKHKGLIVLHPKGYDSFGLPAEQYAIQTGRHPLETTNENILRASSGFRNYMVQILDFITYRSEDKPFPFSDFPS